MGRGRYGGGKRDLLDQYQRVRKEGWAISWGKGGKGERQNEIREGGGGTAVRVVILRVPCDPFPVCKSLVTFRIQLEHSY